MKIFSLLALILALVLGTFAQPVFAGGPTYQVSLARETSPGQFFTLPTDDSGLPQVTVGDSIGLWVGNVGNAEIQWLNAPANAGTFDLGQFNKHWYPKTPGLADVWALIDTTNPLFSDTVSERVLILPVSSPRLNVSSVCNNYSGYTQVVTKVTNTGKSVATSLNFKMRQDGTNLFAVANSGPVFGQFNVTGLKDIYCIGTWFQIGNGGEQRLTIDPFVSSVPIGNLAVGQTVTVKFNLLNKAVPLKMTTSIAAVTYPPECQTAQIALLSGSDMTASNVQLTANLNLVGSTLNISALANGMTTKGTITVPTGYVYVLGSTQIMVQNSTGQWYAKTSADLVGHTISVGDVPSPNGIRIEFNFMKKYSMPSLAIEGYATPQSVGSSTLVAFFQIMNPHYGTIAKSVVASIIIDNYNHYLVVDAKDANGDETMGHFPIPQTQFYSMATMQFQYCVGGKWQSTNLDPNKDNQIFLGDLVGLGSDGMQNMVALSGTLVPVIQPTLSIVATNKYTKPISAVTFVITNTSSVYAGDMYFTDFNTSDGTGGLEGQVLIPGCDYMGYSNPFYINTHSTEVPGSVYIIRNNGIKTVITDDHDLDPPIAVGDLAPGETVTVGISYQSN
jgi:hypothetical protein